ncbi:MAG TPA: anthranilate phosphoribosyltransferase [Candidatus Omnitrophota bacterium]|nr:anthranilate phosphoribosyltransferase [Candidatus Omnitrophota bacterium]HPD85039.1 anthranilate phosphoribosyltransferase [Candidatus Omnitrophota bacterium]HRZ03897.1 anthranilate phosphoribosyltransferase [Candidatus Omnitrophota bacterium]
MKSAIAKIKDKKNLTQEEIQQVMRTIMSGQALKEDIASFLLALRAKGSTVEEITGAAKVMREYCLKVKTNHEVVLDTCGTGGDKKGTFNISTVAAFVIAGAGVAVAKHGNRSVSSSCGSADLLEALGINLSLDAQKLGTCLDKVGIAFLFAPNLHPAMKYAGPVRKELGVETIFNILGPLTNPASATHQMMGIYDKGLVEPIAYVLKNLGIKRAMVVHGHDGLDEVTTTGATFISEYDGNEVSSYPLSPEEFGIAISKSEDLKGGDLNRNVRIAKDVLSGQKGPQRDIVVLNAACALYVTQAVTTVADGIKIAEESIDSGKAAKKLTLLREFTNRAG